MESAARVAVCTVLEELKLRTTVRQVRFVLFGAAARTIYEGFLTQSVTPPTDERFRARPP